MDLLNLIIVDDDKDCINNFIAALKTIYTDLSLSNSCSCGKTEYVNRDIKAICYHISSEVAFNLAIMEIGNYNNSICFMDLSFGDVPKNLDIVLPNPLMKRKAGGGIVLSRLYNPCYSKMLVFISSNFSTTSNAMQNMLGIPKENYVYVIDNISKSIDEKDVAIDIVKHSIDYWHNTRDKSPDVSALLRFIQKCTTPNNVLTHDNLQQHTSLYMEICDILELDETNDYGDSFKALFQLDPIGVNRKIEASTNPRFINRIVLEKILKYIKIDEYIDIGNNEYYLFPIKPALPVLLSISNFIFMCDRNIQPPRFILRNTYDDAIKTIRGCMILKIVNLKTLMERYSYKKEMNTLCGTSMYYHKLLCANCGASKSFPECINGDGSYIYEIEICTSQNIIKLTWDIKYG